MGEQLFRLLVGFFVGIAIARHLGPVHFGELSFAISLAGLFGICATLGLNRILVRELVAATDDQSRIVQLMSTALAMRLVAAVVMFVVCMLYSGLMGEGSFLLVGLIAGGFLFSAFDCIDLYFQSKVQSRFSASARLISFALVTAVRITLLLMSAPVMAFAAVTLLEFFAAAIALLWAYRHRGAGFTVLSVDVSLARRLLIESWPEIIAGFSGLLFMRLDLVMLQHMKGAAAVGTFAVAARLSEIWYFIPMALVSSMYPSLVQSHATDVRLYHSKINRLMVGLISLSYLVGITVTLLAGTVVPALYGAAFQDSANILIIHIWCGLLVGFAQVSGMVFIIEKRIKLNLARNLLGLTAGFVFNLILIPRFGSLGAAWSTLLAMFFAYYLFDGCIKSTRSLFRIKTHAFFLRVAKPDELKHV